MMESAYTDLCICHLKLISVSLCIDFIYFLKNISYKQFAVGRDMSTRVLILFFHSRVMIVTFLLCYFNVKWTAMIKIDNSQQGILNACFIMKIIKLKNMTLKKLTVEMMDSHEEGKITLAEI